MAAICVLTGKLPYLDGFGTSLSYEKTFSKWLCARRNEPVGYILKKTDLNIIYLYKHVTINISLGKAKKPWLDILRKTSFSWWLTPFVASLPYKKPFPKWLRARMNEFIRFIL